MDPSELEKSARIVVQKLKEGHTEESAKGVLRSAGYSEPDIAEVMQKVESIRVAMDSHAPTPAPVSAPTPAPAAHTPQSTASQKSRKVLILIIAAVVIIAVSAFFLLQQRGEDTTPGDASGGAPDADATSVSERNTTTLTSVQKANLTTPSGARIEIPVGAVPFGSQGSAGTMTFTIEEEASQIPSLPEGISPAGPVYQLDSGGSVGFPIKITLPISDDTPIEQVGGLAYYDDSGSWVMVPARVDEQARTVSTYTTHLSLWTSWYGYNPVTLAAWLRENNGGHILVIEDLFPGTNPYPSKLDCVGMDIHTGYGVCVKSWTPANPEDVWQSMANTLIWASGGTPGPLKEASSWVPAGTYELIEMRSILGLSNQPSLDRRCSGTYWRSLGTYEMTPGSSLEFRGGLMDVSGDNWTLATTGNPPPCIVLKPKPHVTGGGSEGQSVTGDGDGSGIAAGTGVTAAAGGGSRLWISSVFGGLVSCDESGQCQDEWDTGKDEMITAIANYKGRLWISYGDSLEACEFPSGVCTNYGAKGGQTSHGSGTISLGEGALVLGSEDQPQEQDIPSNILSMAVYDDKLWLGHASGHLSSCDASGSCVDHGEVATTHPSLGFTPPSEDGSEGPSFDWGGSGDVIFGGTLGAAITSMASHGGKLWLGDEVGNLYSCDSSGSCKKHTEKPVSLRSPRLQAMTSYHGKLWLNHFSVFGGNKISSCDSSGTCTSHEGEGVLSKYSINAMASYKGKLWMGYGNGILASCDEGLSCAEKTRVGAFFGIASMAVYPEEQ